MALTEIARIDEKWESHGSGNDIGEIKQPLLTITYWSALGQARITRDEWLLVTIGGKWQIAKEQCLILSNPRQEGDVI